MDPRSADPARNAALAGALAEVLRRHLPRESLAALGEPAADLGALGLRSLELAGLIADLEATFGVEFPEELLVPGTFRTVATIATAIAALGAGQDG